MLLVAASASAQYKVGDFYNENGKQGIVFEVDESGRHGKIVSMVESSLLFEGVEYMGVKNIPNVFSSSTRDMLRDMPKEGLIYGYEYEENKYFHTCYKFTSASKLGEGPLPWAVSGSKNLKRAMRMTKDEADGAKNQRKIASLPNWQEEFPAFAWCASLGEGWYLPAVGELIIIFENKEQINASLAEKGGVPLWDKFCEYSMPDEKDLYQYPFYWSSSHGYIGILNDAVLTGEATLRCFVRAVSAF